MRLTAEMPTVMGPDSVANNLERMETEYMMMLLIPVEVG